MQLFISSAILFLVFANVLDTRATFCFPCSFSKGEVRFSCKRFTICRLIGSFSETDSVFRILEVFSLSFPFRMYFLLVFAVFWNMWLYWLFSYLARWTHPQELESALEGVTMYIRNTSSVESVFLKWTNPHRLKSFYISSDGVRTLINLDFWHPRCCQEDYIWGCCENLIRLPSIIWRGCSIWKALSFHSVFSDVVHALEASVFFLCGPHGFAVFFLSSIEPFRSLDVYTWILFHES